MQNLKSILERNIELERQKLYKQQQYLAYQNQEIQAVFHHEVAGIQRIFDDQNPLYWDFNLVVDIVDDHRHQIRLSTVREGKAPEPVVTEYYYRGHAVKKSAPKSEIKPECISELYATWVSDQNKWSIIQGNGTATYGERPQMLGSRNDLLKDFLNQTVKDIARLLETEASEE